MLNYLMFRRQTHLVKSPQNILILLFLLVSLMSVFVAFNPARTLERIPKLLRVLSLYFFAINFIKSENHFRSALWLFVIGGFVCTLYGFFDPAQTIGRFEGAIGQPNGYALTMTPRIPIALALIVVDKNLFKRVFLAFTVLIISYGVILSASRGGLLSISFALIVFAALQENRKTWLGVIIIVFALGILIMPLDVKIRVGLSDAYTSTDLGNSTDRRLTYQIYGLELFQKYPILGIGLDGFAEAYAQSEYRFLIRTQTLRVAHNTYLEIATGTGVVGFLPFVGILGFTVYLAWKYSRKKYWHVNAELTNLTSGLFAALSGYYLGMLFGSRQYEKTLWFLFALPIVVEALFNAQIKAKNSSELLTKQALIESESE
jgi:O-antigen ligase